MPIWVRNLVMIVVLGVWAIVVVGDWIRTGTIPDPVTWGVPGAIYFTLNPSWPRRTPPSNPPEQVHP